MELTTKGQSLGRAFRRQAKRYLYRLQEIIGQSLKSDRESEFTEVEYFEMNYAANMATISLLAAILAYIDPEYKADDYAEESGTPSRSDN